MSATGHMKLSELSSHIKNVLKQSFDNQVFWVVAEISGHKYYPEKGWHYLDLVEKMEGTNTEAAKLKCNVWTETAKKIIEFEKITGQKFADGLQVLVKVRVEYHIVYGLSLVMTDIDHSFTLGNLERQRLETLMRLVKENPGKVSLEGDEYITANKQTLLGMVIQRIALVASGNSEGYHDFISNIQRNKFGYKFDIDHYHSTVQGKDAERELIDTMIRIYQSGKNYDCVVMIRGGGARTDFLVFDTYGVARAVARFPIPVITGIGHHRDISIVDMMAHTHTNAPTKAAEFIIGHNHAFEENILKFQRDIIIRSQKRIAKSKDELNRIENIILHQGKIFVNHRKDDLVKLRQVVTFRSGQILLNRHRQLSQMQALLGTKPLVQLRSELKEMENVMSKLKLSAGMLIQNQQANLEHYRVVLRMMNPRNILKKGFAIVKQNGKVMKSSSTFERGTEIQISMSDAEILAGVIAVNKNENGKENEL